jgi:Arc/MetJ-type ribon-helix-helix transcriptional regulator
MNKPNTYAKVSVSLPAELWDWVKNQQTASGISVPASRVIAAAVELLRTRDAKRVTRRK